MPATYEPIASTTLGSAAADVTFSSVPGTFTDLVLVISGRKSTGTGTDDYKLNFNSDTGSNYSQTFLFGNGSSASSGRNSNLAYGPVGRFASSTASGPSVNVIHIMSYANSNVFKTILDSSASEADVIRRVVLWRSTNAITSIKIEGSLASLGSGTTLSLYGIKAA